MTGASLFHFKDVYRLIPFHFSIPVCHQHTRFLFSFFFFLREFVFTTGWLASFSVHSTRRKSFHLLLTYIRRAIKNKRQVFKEKSDNRCRLTFLTRSRIGIDGTRLPLDRQRAAASRPFQIAFPRIINGYRHYRVALRDYETRR